MNDKQFNITFWIITILGTILASHLILLACRAMWAIIKQSDLYFLR